MRHFQGSVGVCFYLFTVIILQDEVKYLVSKDGIKTDPSKIDCLKT